MLESILIGSASTTNKTSVNTTQTRTNTLYVVLLQ